jgi:carbon storage regulator CsrA
LFIDLFYDLKGMSMLVLTRKAGETILIDGDILIKIVAVRGNAIKIGIEAPKTTRVKRGELCREQQNIITKKESQACATIAASYLQENRVAICAPTVLKNESRNGTRND